MSGRSYDVFLSDVRVGQLRDEPDGRVGFRFAPEYRETPRRPVLGQFFLDQGLEQPYKSRAAGQLPRFFWNLLPEGVFRSVLLSSFSPRPPDDLALLYLLGEDLPGAIRVVSSQDELELGPEPGGAETEEETPLGERFGFSLAGAQLKFSMLREHDRFVLPTHNSRGDWILKGAATAAYPGIVENEWSILAWARLAGFDVPECEIAEWETLQSIHQHLLPNSRALAVQRFDRAGVLRIHQEDFAQVLDVPPVPSQRKFDKSAAELGQSAYLILGDAGFEEFLRRLVFTVASGNNDAHLKNWSLLYRDGRTPSWTPLYDQLFTGAWPQFRPGRPALPLPGPRHFSELRLEALLEISRRTKYSEDATRRVVGETIDRLRTTLPEILRQGVMLEDHVRALDEHWKSVPLLAGG